MIRLTLSLLLTTSVLLATPYRRIDCQLLPQTIAAPHLGRANGWKTKQFLSLPYHAPSHTTTTRHSAAVSGQNWCGFVSATPKSPRKHSVDEVVGSWVVPTITPPSTNTPSLIGIWVGIDGYGSSTVEQTGTAHGWMQDSNGNWGALNYAWIEMFPTGSAMLANFPLNAGDHIAAKVRYKGKGLYLLTLANKTQRIFTSTTTTMPSHSPNPQRLSAEWIVENQLAAGLPVPNFGAVSFYNCKAKINGSSGTSSNKRWRNLRLAGTNSNGGVVTQPSAGSHHGRNFTVTFLQAQ